MFFPGRWSHLVSLALLAQHTKGQKTMTQYLYIHDKNTTQANTTQTRHKHKIKHKTNLSAAQTAMTLSCALNLRTVALLVLTLFATTQTAWAKYVRYIDANGKEKKSNATQLTEYNASDLTDGWYYVGRNESIGCLTIKGDVHIILMDGKHCEIKREKYSPIMLGSGKLTIYGQKMSPERPLKYFFAPIWYLNNFTILVT